MEDQQIIDLFWIRSENAVAEASAKYTHYCYRIAHSILKDTQDSTECVNDTWMKAWSAIPPNRPQRLSIYLGKITRNLALHRYEARAAQKRGKGQLPLASEELSPCLPGAQDAQ